jgi:hypothetical protein
VNWGLRKEAVPDTWVFREHFWEEMRVWTKQKNGKIWEHGKYLWATVYAEGALGNARERSYSYKFLAGGRSPLLWGSGNSLSLTAMRPWRIYHSFIPQCLTCKMGDSKTCYIKMLWRTVESRSIIKPLEQCSTHSMADTSNIPLIFLLCAECFRVCSIFHFPDLYHIKKSFCSIVWINMKLLLISRKDVLSLCCSSYFK